MQYPWRVMGRWVTWGCNPRDQALLPTPSLWHRHLFKYLCPESSTAGLSDLLCFLIPTAPSHPFPPQKAPGRNASSSASPVPPSLCYPIATNEPPFFLTWASAWSCHSSLNHPSPPLYFSKCPFYKHLPISSLLFYKIFFLIHTLLSHCFSIPIPHWLQWLQFLTCPVSKALTVDFCPQSSVQPISS